MAKKERQSNIECLRIVVILGIIIAHYNNPTIGGGIAYVREGTINFYIMYFLNSLFACGVNLFLLISGYFMCESKKCSIWRPIELVIQVALFREVSYLADVILKKVPLSLRSIISSLIPANYFVILYCAVFLLSPFINLLMSKLSQKNLKKFVLLLVLLFSVFATIADVLGELRGSSFIGLSTIGAYGSQWGYSIVNFMLMYIIGAYVRKGELRIVYWKNGKLAALFLANVGVIMLWARVNDRIGYFTVQSAWEYCNPLIILNAVIVFTLFSRMHLGVNKIINSLAESVFTVFLVHHVFFPFLNIEKYVTGNSIHILLHMLGSAVTIFLICWCVHKLYHMIVDPVFRLLSGTFNRMTIAVED